MEGEDLGVGRSHHTNDVNMYLLDGKGGGGGVQTVLRPFLIVSIGGGSKQSLRPFLMVSVRALES